jgi:hypothetical protein
MSASSVVRALHWIFNINRYFRILEPAVVQDAILRALPKPNRLEVTVDSANVLAMTVSCSFHLT